VGEPPRARPGGHAVMDELERVVRAYNGACSHDMIADIMAFFTADAVIYDLNHPPVAGREAIGVFWGRVRARWGGATWDTNLVVSDGRVAVTEWTMHGRRGEAAFALGNATLMLKMSGNG